jgi:hypothetical protein
MKRSQSYLIGIAVLAVVEGAIQQMLFAHADAARISFAVTIFPTAIFLYLWVKADAAERGLRMPTGATLLVPLIAVIGVPYYLIRSRSLAAASWQIAFAIVFAVSLNYLSWGGQLLVYAALTFGSSYHILGGS